MINMHYTIHGECVFVHMNSSVCARQASELGKPREMRPKIPGCGKAAVSEWSA